MAESPQLTGQAAPVTAEGSRKLSAENVAVASLCLGSLLAVTGVYLLAGIGWAVLTAAAPLLLLGGVLFRGLLHAE